MRQKLLLTALLFSSFIWNTAKATETEPNDTKAQANTLVLNGSDNGSITPAGEVDWWKITTNKDGQLTISWTSSSGSNVSAYLYDNDGLTLLGSGTTTTNTSFSKDIVRDPDQQQATTTVGQTGDRLDKLSVVDPARLELDRERLPTLDEVHQPVDVHRYRLRITMRVSHDIAFDAITMGSDA